MPFENKLHFTPAIYYSLKGYKATLNKPSLPPSRKAVNNDTRIHPVETAAMFQYDFSAKPAHFFIKSGFAIDFAMSGTEKFDTLPRVSVSRQMKFSFKDYGLVTASANLHFGYELARGLILFAQYAHGLISLNNADHGPKIFNRIAGLSLGYYLGRNSKLTDATK